jgi:hypothetical protein
VFRVPLQAALDLDTERLLGWHGGHVHAVLQALEERDATEELVGDRQGFDNVDAERFHQLSELWLEQRLFGGRLRLKIGKADANADFARVEASGGFLPRPGHERQPLRRGDEVALAGGGRLRWRDPRELPRPHRQPRPRDVLRGAGRPGAASRAP